MKIIFLLLSLTLSSSILAQVKQSKSGICHDAQSKFYERTKKFISFNTLEECLAADGRLPKNYQGSVNAKVLVDEADSKDSFKSYLIAIERHFYKLLL